jgi:hydroxyacylglutathione hydrolase
MALTVKTLVFNAFQVNTYVISDELGNALIVDPACYSPREQEDLLAYLMDNQLTPKYVVNTHSHVDHVLGTGFLYRKFDLKPLIHKAGLPFYANLSDYANTFGFEVDDLVVPESFLEDGDELILGEHPLKIHYTPGHADGSICLVHESGRWILTGDLLFRTSIGRTDLPTGSLELLLKSVRDKILIYQDDFILYPGHGPSTTIGYERLHNPFL